MSNNIPIHKKRGLDPHMITCINCGKDYGVSIGVIMRAKDDNKNIHYCQRGQIDEYNKNFVKTGYKEITDWREITDSWEKIPLGLCDKCNEDIEKVNEAITAGGISFHCEECKRRGVFLANTKIAKQIRKEYNTPAPEAIEITLENCKQHGILDAHKKSETSPNTTIH